MTEIAFHFNAPDKLSYACRLLRKAYGSGARIAVTGDRGLLHELDLALWSFAPLEFVPHCDAAAETVVLSASAVVLTQALAMSPHHGVAVNLGDEVPAGFERFERLIEVVTQQDQDRLCARGRWKHYADRGYAIVRHDLAPKS